MTMGAYDGAKVCELVGAYIYIYMLNILSGKYNKNNDDRDDGLAVLKMKNGPQSNQMEKSTWNLQILYKTKQRN